MALDRLVQEAMAGLPAERPPTVAAMLRRLHTILRHAGADEPGRSITITPLRPPGRQTRVIEAPAPEPAAPVGPAMPPRPRLWPMYGLAASVVLVLVLVVSRDERARRRGDEAVAELAARVARDGTKAAVASRCDPDDAGTTWRRAEAEAGVTAAASGSAAKNRTWMSAPGATAAGATAAGATTGDAPSPRPDLASARQRSLRRTLQSARGDVLACFDELGGNRGKRIDVRVKIEADGRAGEVTIGGAARTSLVRCITAALRAQTYANGPAAVMVRHSFTFATESERP